jgi:hypothetical protein
MGLVVIAGSLILLIVIMFVWFWWVTKDLRNED